MTTGRFMERREILTDNGGTCTDTLRTPFPSPKDIISFSLEVPLLLFHFLPGPKCQALFALGSH